MTYSPRAGSIASRVIELLTARAPARMTSADICDEIDCEVQSFHPSIAMAISAGIVASEVRDDVHCYSLGYGIPLVVPTKVEDRPAPPQLDPAPARAKKPGRIAKAPKAARKTKPKTPRPAPIRKPAPKVKRAKPRKVKRHAVAVLADEVSGRQELVHNKDRLKSLIAANGHSAPFTESPASDLRCGFFNNGDLQIEVPGKKWCVLDRHELRDLVSYLRKLDQLSFSAMERAPT